MSKQQNPFEKNQRPGHERTIKWCAWDILKEDNACYSTERIAELVLERSLRKEMKPSSISKELGASKAHFRLSSEGWSLRGDGDDDGSVDQSPPGRSTSPEAVKKRKERELASLQQPEIVVTRRVSKPPTEWWCNPDEDEDIDIMSGASSPSLALLQRSHERREEKTAAPKTVPSVQEHTIESSGGGGSGTPGGAEDGGDDNQVMDIDILSDAGVTRSDDGDVLEKKRQKIEVVVQAAVVVEKIVPHQEERKKEGERKMEKVVVEEIQPMNGSSDAAAVQLENPPPPPPSIIEEDEVILPLSAEAIPITATAAIPTTTTTTIKKPAAAVVVADVLPPKPPLPTNGGAGGAPKPFLIPKRKPATTAPPSTTVPPAITNTSTSSPMDRTKKESPPNGGNGGRQSVPPQPPAPPAPSQPGKGSKNGSKPPLPLPPPQQQQYQKSYQGEREMKRPLSMQNLHGSAGGGGGGGNAQARGPPVAVKPQPWEDMLWENKGAFARAWKRMEWPGTFTSLPQSAEPATITDKQRKSWEKARSRFGSLHHTNTTTTANGKQSEAEDEDNVLHQLKHDPYPVRPQELLYVRVMQCNTTTEQKCLEKSVFVSNHHADVDGIEPGRSLILLHNFDTRIIYGCYLAVDVGRNLDSSFGKEWSHQVKVKPLLLFTPLPSSLFEAFLPRKINPKDGKPMKFLEKGTAAVKEVWELMHLYSGKGFKPP